MRRDEDGQEGNRNEGDEFLLRADDDGVQPTRAVWSGERPFNHPADAGRDEPQPRARLAKVPPAQQTASGVNAGCSAGICGGWMIPGSLATNR